MQTFRKSERLCNYNLINLLFEKGSFFYCYPFKVQWFILDKPIEKHVLKPMPFVFSSAEINNTSIIEKQNPSFPFRKIPENAFFIYPAKCIITVSSKKFKKAADRNYIKRLIKESYRKNKNSFYSLFNGKNKICLLAFIYTGKTIPDYNEIEEKIILSLQLLKKEIAPLLEDWPKAD